MTAREKFLAVEMGGQMRLHLVRDEGPMLNSFRSALCGYRAKVLSVYTPSNRPMGVSMCDRCTGELMRG